MLPLLIPALAQGAVGLFQKIQGASRAKKLKRPTRSTPAAVQEATARARYGAQAGQAPGSAVARQGIATTMAGTTSALGKAGGSAASTMAGALGAQQQANQASQQQNIQDAQYQQQANTQYLQQLDRMGQEQARNWDWNAAQKFQEEAAAAQRLQESGMQNMMGGLNTASQIGFMDKMGYFDEANEKRKKDKADKKLIKLQNLQLGRQAQSAMQNMYQPPVLQGQAQQIPGGLPYGSMFQPQSMQGQAQQIPGGLPYGSMFQPQSMLGVPAQNVGMPWR